MSKRRTKAKTPRGDRFDLAKFFETTAKGRTISTHPKKQIIFTQGDAAGEVIYIKKGKVKVTVISEHGKVQRSVPQRETDEASDAWASGEKIVMAGLVRGHPRLGPGPAAGRGCPRQARA